MLIDFKSSLQAPGRADLEQLDKTISCGLVSLTEKVNPELMEAAVVQDIAGILDVWNANHEPNDHLACKLENEFWYLYWCNREFKHTPLSLRVIVINFTRVAAHA